MFFRSVMAALAAAVCVSAPAQANWNESFDGGAANLDWQLNGNQLNDVDVLVPDWPVVNAGSVYGEFRDPANLTTPDPEAIVGAYAAVDQVFTDVTVSAWINLDPQAIGDSTITGLFARTDTQAGTGYAFGVAMSDGEWGIFKFTDDQGEDTFDLVVSDLDNDPNTTALATDTALYLVFDIAGTTLTGRVFDAPNGNLLGEMSTTDNMFAAGVAGVFAELEDPGVTGQQLFATFDDISAVGVPEPTSIALLAVGGVAALRRRR